MTKKIITLALFALLTFSCCIPAFAEAKFTKTGETVSVYTDRADIEKIAAKEGLSQAQTKKIKRIEITREVSEESETLSDTGSEKKTSLWYEIRSVRHEAPFVIPDEIIGAYIFSGPCEGGGIYKTEKYPVMSLGVRLGRRAVAKKAGVDIRRKYCIEKELTLPVKQGETAAVKTRTLYRRTAFDIYNRFTGKPIREYAYLDKPVGIEITVIIY